MSCSRMAEPGTQLSDPGIGLGFLHRIHLCIQARARWAVVCGRPAPTSPSATGRRQQAHLKLKTGMPLSGWRQKASGVSSTSTVRASGRPSRARSLMQGYCGCRRPRAPHHPRPSHPAPRGPLLGHTTRAVCCAGGRAAALLKGSSCAAGAAPVASRAEAAAEGTETHQGAALGGRAVQAAVEAAVALLQALGDGDGVVLHPRREQDDLCSAPRGRSSGSWGHPAAGASTDETEGGAFRQCDSESIQAAGLSSAQESKVRHNCCTNAFADRVDIVVLEAASRNPNSIVPSRQPPQKGQGSTGCGAPANSQSWAKNSLRPGRSTTKTPLGLMRAPRPTT